jgi:hypothetical protein
MNNSKTFNFYFSTMESRLFREALEDISNTQTISHYKTIILEKIVHDSYPNDIHIKKWTSSEIQVNRLLKQMQKEGLIKIEYINDRGFIRRKLTKI